MFVRCVLPSCDEDTDHTFGTTPVLRTRGVTTCAAVPDWSARCGVSPLPGDRRASARTTQAKKKKQSQRRRLNLSCKINDPIATGKILPVSLWFFFFFALLCFNHRLSVRFPSPDDVSIIKSHGQSWAINGHFFFHIPIAARLAMSVGTGSPIIMGTHGEFWRKHGITQATV
jgi:hypothetical protein